MPVVPRAFLCFDTPRRGRVYRRWDRVMTVKGLFTSLGNVSSTSRGISSTPANSGSDLAHHVITSRQKRRGGQQQKRSEEEALLCTNKKSTLAANDK